MYKKPITYQDFDGVTVTEDFYFNLTKTELLILESQTPGGLGASLERIAKSNSFDQIVSEFVRIVLATYGVRSEDGRRFIKDEQVVKEFQQTNAWDELFWELATKADAAAEFVNGVFPKDMDKLLSSVNVPSYEQLAGQAPKQDPMFAPPPSPIHKYQTETE